MLDKKDTYFDSLLEPPNEHVIAKKLPPTMWVQLDNCVKDNKNILMFAHWSLMVAKGIFKEVLFIFSIDDIDASFGWWSM